MSAVDDLRDRIELGRVVVPPHVKVIGGKPVRVKGYSYTRRGGKKRVVIAEKAQTSEQEWARNPVRGVDFEDQRKSGPKIEVDPARMNAALRAAGVVGGKDFRVKVRVRDQAQAGQQGVAQQIGPNSFRVVISVAPKARLENRHLYVLNNSLVHEMRHVAQHQQDPDMSAKYVHFQQTVGYANNPYEVEARAYGRLADHSGEKVIPKGLGPAQGEVVWGLLPADTEMSAPDEYDPEEWDAALDALLGLPAAELQQIMQSGSPIQQAAAEVLLGQM